MTCIQCGAALLQDDKFCPDCGSALTPAVRSCAACRFPLREGARFCIRCGVSVADAVPASARSTSLPLVSAASSGLDKVKTPLTRRDVPIQSQTYRHEASQRLPRKENETKPNRGPVAVIVLGCGLGLAVYLSLRVDNSGPYKAADRHPSEATPMTKSASGTLGTTRPNLEGFPIKRAFTQLYGNYDPNLDGAFWRTTGAPADLAQWSGKPVFIRPLISRSFEEAGVPRHVLVTNSLEVKDGDVIKQGTGCRSCGSLIGAAVFERHGNDWNLISRHDFLTAAGSWGAPPKVSVDFPGAGGIELQFENPSGDPRKPAKTYSIQLKERKGVTPAVADPRARADAKK